MIKMNEEERKQKARDRAKEYYRNNKEKIRVRQREYARKKYRESEEYRKKNYERCKKYKENNRPKIAMLQRKYMAKKRSLGELPKTKNQIIEELQNNWNELKVFLKEMKNRQEHILSNGDTNYDLGILAMTEETISKMQELENRR